jgi:hypothetical protein
MITTYRQYQEALARLADLESATDLNNEVPAELFSEVCQLSEDVENYEVGGFEANEKTPAPSEW